MGRGLPFFLRCQQSRVRVSHLAAGGSVPAEILQNIRADSADMDFVGMNPARDVEQVSDVLRTSPSRATSSESRIVQTREGPCPRWILAMQEGEPGEDHSGQTGPRLEVGRSS